MSPGAITRAGAAAAEANGAAGLVTPTDNAIADAAIVITGTSTAAPALPLYSATLPELVGQLFTQKLAPMFALIQQLQANVAAFTQPPPPQGQQPLLPAPAAAPTPITAIVREFKRASVMTLRQLDGTPFTNFAQKQSWIEICEQVQQLEVITGVIRVKVGTETEGMDDAAALAYAKEAFSAITEEIAAVSAEINFNASIAVKVDTHGPSFASIAKRELAGSYRGDHSHAADAIVAATKICIQNERSASSSPNYGHNSYGRGFAAHSDRHSDRGRDFPPRPTHNQHGKGQRQDHGYKPDITGSRPPRWATPATFVGEAGRNRGR